MKFRILVIPVKDGNGYIARCGSFSFWDFTREAVIAQMVAVIFQLNQQNKLIGH